jgi:hypothetical protein
MRLSRRSWFALGWLLLLLVSCEGEARSRLGVRVITGLVPGIEFVRAESNVLGLVDERQRELRFEDSLTATVGDTFARGVRVADFDALPNGPIAVRVRLRRRDGSILIERTTTIALREDYELVVPLTRDCVARECPSPGGSPALNACLAGACVNPSCTRESPENCPPDLFCNEANPCAPSSACATRSCIEGICVEIPNETGVTCAPDEWCDPEGDDDGCAPLEPEPPGPMGPVCGTVCTETRGACNVGFWDCTAGTPTCRPFVDRVAGTLCGATPQEVCDLTGECVLCPAGAECQIGCGAGVVSCASGSAECVLGARVAPGDACSDTGVFIEGEPDDSLTGACGATGICLENGQNPGIVVLGASSLEVTESGSNATFTVRLASQPDGDVRVPVASSDTGESVVTPAELVFTRDNWRGERTITVTGVDDFAADGPQMSTILLGPATSDDPAYEGRSASGPVVNTLDDESAGIRVVAAPSPRTSEAGDAATFSVVLLSQPLADVNIELRSSDSTEGTVAPTALVFTVDNWRAPQTVTVTGADDEEEDGDVAFSVVTMPADSTDPNYVGLNADDVAFVNVDDETAALFVTNADGLEVAESGSTASFRVRLTSRPAANVVVTFVSSDAGEAEVSSGVLSFDADNWSVAQDVTVTGVDDTLVDGTQNVNIVLSSVVTTDPNYASVVAAPVTVRVIDDETPGALVSPLTGATTSEGGASASVGIVLTAAPTSNVTFPVRSGDPSEATVDVSFVTFTPENWAETQFVTVTGVNDAIADGDQSFTIFFDAATSDGLYAGLNPPDAVLTNQDDDAPGITVTPTTLITSERGLEASFTVVLRSEPSSAVIVSLTNSDESEASLSTATLNFDASNWSTPQTVVVRGVDDAITDGQIVTTISAAATSEDANYVRALPNVLVTNFDDEGATVSITYVGALPLLTTEQGGTSALSVRLGRQPTAPVVIEFLSSNLDEIRMTSTSLTFTRQNWSRVQTVSLRGIADDVEDEDALVTVVIPSVTTTDYAYVGLDPSDLPALNVDADTRRCVGCTSRYLPTASGLAPSAVSDDGRYVTFSMSNQAYRRDMTTNTIEVMSVSITGGTGNAASSRASISPNGRFVCFQSAASDLTADDIVVGADIFVRDAVLGTTRLASRNSAGAQFGGSMENCDVSDDGRYVVFSTATNGVVPGDTNGYYDSFVRDLQENTTEIVSVDSSGTIGANVSRFNVMSADGRYVVFLSSSFGRYNHVYRRDRELGVTEMVSSWISGDRMNDGAISFDMSSDGRFVVFESTASNVVAGDTNGVDDVFMRDMQAGTTVAASTTPEGVWTPCGARYPAVAADGSAVAFVCLNDVPGAVADDTNGGRDGFVRDFENDTLTLVTRNRAGLPVGGVTTSFGSGSGISSTTRRAVFIAGRVQINHRYSGSGVYSLPY